MIREKIKKILEDEGYTSSSIKSILCGRRKPNPTRRYRYEKIFGIPFYAWGKNLKLFLDLNNTTNNGNTATPQGQHEDKK